VSINPIDYKVTFKVVGSDYWNNEQPSIKARGICGSGIIDAVAEMLNAGIIKPSGAFDRGISTPRLLRNKRELEFVVAWSDETSLDSDITVSQGDIRAVQLAKGALLAGARVMMSKLGIKQLDKIILTGAFGVHIDKGKAMTVGLFPNCDLDKVYPVSNAAGEGARLALLNIDKRQEAAEVAQRVEYVELSLEPSFSEEFVNAMIFPNTDSSPSAARD